MRGLNSGYTLIELMIVVVITSILLAVATPKLTAMVEKSKEGATKSNLGLIRSCLAVYYADNEGAYPEDALGSLKSGGKYLSEIPRADIYNTFHHPASSRVEQIDSLSSLLPDTGGWAYVSNRASPDWGKAIINCSHLDITGRAWSAF